MEENYINIYKKATNKIIPIGYDIHHINLNHNDNNISNLVMFPKDLHNKYHTLLLRLPKDLNFRTELTSIIAGGNAYNKKTLNDLINFIYVWEECCKWVDYRDYLLGLIPNIHNITVDYE